MSIIKRTLLEARPQELGKIKIGGKGDHRPVKGKPGETFQLPVKYDHFVVTTRNRGPDGNFVKDARIHGHPLVGDTPTELDAVLMYHDLEENFLSSMVQYKGRKRTVECDGETMCDLLSGDLGACPRTPGGKECTCKPYARLHVQLLASPYTAGYHVLRTTSWESTNNIQTALEEIHGMFGTLFRAPVRLVLYPSEDVYEEGGQTRTSQSHKVGLVLAMSMEEVGQRMLDATRQLNATRRELRLTAGEVLAELNERDVMEAEDIAGEFFSPEPATEADELADALRAQAAERTGTHEAPRPPVVDGDFEIEGEEKEDDGPAASPGMIAQVENLLAKAREAGALTDDMKAHAEVALLRGTERLVNGALTDLSLALIRKRAGESPPAEQGSLLDEVKP